MVMLIGDNNDNSHIEEKAKTLDIHMHFCGFSQHHSFIQGRPGNEATQK